MTSIEISRAEYLKKYLNNSAKEKKKKKKHATVQGIRVIDDDTYLPIPPAPKDKIDIKKFITKFEVNELSEDEDELLLEKAKKAENVSKFKNNSFMTINDESGNIDLQISNVETAIKASSPSTDQLKLKTKKKKDKDYSPIRCKKNDIHALNYKLKVENSPLRSQQDNLSPRATIKAKVIVREKIRNNNSPVSNKRRKDDNSPVRKHAAQSSNILNRNDDNSPIRKSKPNNQSDKSRVIQDFNDNSPPRKREKKFSPSGNERFAKDGNDGRFAAPQKRVAQYNRRRGREPEDLEKKERESKKQMEMEEKYKKWRVGEAQSRKREEKLKEMEEVMQEGFTRHADNKAMNEHLKSIINDEDPMAQYFKTKQHKIEMKSGVVYKKYNGNWPPNRYEICPGYRWDGVNRSNGFEGKLALAENKKRAQETEAYRAIVECGE